MTVRFCAGAMIVSAWKSGSVCVPPIARVKPGVRSSANTGVMRVAGSPVTAS